jgi:hypothetical protein
MSRLGPDGDAVDLGRRDRGHAAALWCAGENGAQRRGPARSECRLDDDGTGPGPGRRFSAGIRHLVNRNLRPSQATAAVLSAAGRENLALIAWPIPLPVARVLNAEFGTSFTGRPPEQSALSAPSGGLMSGPYRYRLARCWT